MLNARVLAASILIAASSAVAQEPPTVTVLKAARLFDGRSDTTVANAVVIVEGGRIKAVGSALAVPAGAPCSTWATPRCCPASSTRTSHLTGESSTTGTRDAVEGCARRARDGHPRRRVRAADVDGGLHHGAQPGRGRLRRRRPAQRDRHGLRRRPAHPRRRTTRSARAAATATTPASPTCCSARSRGSRRASRPGRTASATPSASRSSTAPTSSRSARPAACSR